MKILEHYQRNDNDDDENTIYIKKNIEYDSIVKITKMPSFKMR
jgi:hypothetical protein